MSFPAEREAWETGKVNEHETRYRLPRKQAQAKKVPIFVVKGPHCPYKRRKGRIRAREAKGRNQEGASSGWEFCWQGLLGPGLETR